MYSRYRGVPRRLKSAEPLEKAVDLPTRGTYDAGPGRQRSHQRVMQPMAVEQRQHVYAAIGFAELPRGGRAVRRGADVGVRLRNNLRSRRCARREQQNRNLTGAGGFVQYCILLAADERERA